MGSRGGGGDGGRGLGAKVAAVVDEGYEEGGSGVLHRPEG